MISYQFASDAALVGREVATSAQRKARTRKRGSGDSAGVRVRKRFGQLPIERWIYPKLKLELYLHRYQFVTGSNFVALVATLKIE
jgi:hypothetical protein